MSKAIPVFLCLLSALFLFSYIPAFAPVYAEVFTVSTTEDTNDGRCDENCSFREAVEAANENPGFDELRFAIPTENSGYINPDGSRSSSNEPAGTYTAQEHGFYRLPITSDIEAKGDDGVFINGYTQEHAYRNTAPFGEPINTKLMIQLVFENESNLLLYDTNNNRISGLNIQQGMVLVGYGSERNWIEGNFIGTSIDGMVAIPTGNIHIDKGSTYSLIGTNGDEEADEGERNIISGITEIGIRVGFFEEVYDDIAYEPTLGNKVAGNYIGTDRSGERCTANFFRSALSIEGGGQNVQTRIGSDLDGLSDEEERNIIGCVSNSIEGSEGATIMLNAVDSRIAANYIGLSVNNTELSIESEKVYPHLWSYNSVSEEEQIYQNRENEVLQNVIGYASSHNVVLQGSNNTLARNTIRDAAGAGVIISSYSRPVEGEQIISSENSLTENWVFQNKGPGIFEYAPLTQHTALSVNTIFQNQGLGIDIGEQFLMEEATSAAAIMRNDPQDIDQLSSGNDLMNYPVLKKMGKTRDGYLLVLLDAPFLPDESPFQLEIFDNGPGTGIETRQGKYFIGSGTFSSAGENVLVPVKIGSYTPIRATNITATAQNTNGSTSEFSAPPTDTSLSSLPPLIQVNGGERRVMSRDITVSVGDLSPVAGIQEVALSDSPSFDETDWQPYQESFTWQLTEGDGVKDIYVKLRTDTGYETDPILIQVGLNTSLNPTPIPTQFIPEGIGLAAGGNGGSGGGVNTSVQVQPGALGFLIPDLSDILTFFVRLIFVLVGIAALLYALWGAFSWVTSGGEQENLDKARQKIIAAFVGIILVVVILATIVAFEQFIFQDRVCFGLSCPVVIPSLLESCVPNPQYAQPPPPEIEGGSPWFYPPGADSTAECCPQVAGTGEVRVVTGWLDDTGTFGNNRYKVCCVYGDYDGDQVCDSPVISGNN